MTSSPSASALDAATLPMLSPCRASHTSRTTSPPPFPGGPSDPSAAWVRGEPVAIRGRRRAVLRRATSHCTKGDATRFPMLTSTCIVVPSVLTSTRPHHHTSTAKEDDVNDDVSWQTTTHRAHGERRTHRCTAGSADRRGGTGLRCGRHHHHPQSRLRG